MPIDKIDSGGSAQLILSNTTPVIGAPRKKSHPLVHEVWAVGKVNENRCKEIARRAERPLRFLDKLSGSNGTMNLSKLRAERDILVLQSRTSPFISRFEHPLGKCTKFYKLTAYNNCNFWCEYCYLYLTFRTYPYSVHYTNYEKLWRELAIFDRSQIPPSLRILNLGELSDPLAIDDITQFSTTLIAHLIQETKKTRVLFLTKSDTVGNLLNIDHKGKVVISFSVNSDKVYKILEHRTASPSARLAAAREIQDAGYEVRLRIDPIIYYSTWKQDYARLVEQITDVLKPTVITLGEYRPSNGLAAHIRSRFPNSSLLKINGSLVKDQGKLRYSRERRHEMFGWIVSRLRKAGFKRIGLCKEGPIEWSSLGLGPSLCCNCIEINNNSDDPTKQ